mmetsp:Transcript_15595/g.36490  ORF Transcript_15595/g.36490 Transcript_15595/m.36490 type:complete len:205 (-) Transcript_15595:2003-2617(-)
MPQLSNVLEGRLALEGVGMTLPDALEKQVEARLLVLTQLAQGGSTGLEMPHAHNLNALQRCHIIQHAPKRMQYVLVVEGNLPRERHHTNENHAESNGGVDERAPCSISVALLYIHKNDALWVGLALERLARVAPIFKVSLLSRPALNDVLDNFEQVDSGISDCLVEEARIAVWRGIRPHQNSLYSEINETFAFGLPVVPICGRA